MVAGCDRLPGKQEPAPAAAAAPRPAAAAQAEPLAAGTTPMNQRVAVLGLLNKRNGISRDLTLRPGQAVRIKDVIVRLRACEATPPCLNVVEHPVYDVWPKRCVMNFPAAAEEAGAVKDDSSPSSDSQEGGGA
jgi:hypothetical protein